MRRVGASLAAWIAKEGLRSLLALARTSASRDVIAGQLFIFYDWCASTTIDELHTLATTIETRWPEIEAFIEYVSTAPAPRGQQQRQQDHRPLEFEEPVYPITLDSSKTYSGVRRSGR